MVKDAHYNRAKIFYDQGNLVDAKNEIKKALNIDRNDISAINLLQDINNRTRRRSTPTPIQKKNDFKDALHRIATTLNWQKNWGLYLVAVGVIAIVLIYGVFRSNTPPKPEESWGGNKFDQKPLIDPIDYAKIGYDHLENEAYHEAIDALKKAISNNQGDEKVYNSLGIAYYNTQAYEAAVTAFQEGISLNPESKELHFNLGCAYYKIKKFDDAKSAAEEALKIDPNYEAARQLLEGLPKELKPNLSMGKPSLVEPSGDGFLNANETADIKFTVKNSGGTVSDISVWIKWDSTLGLKYDPQVIPILHQNESKTIKISITASSTVKGKKGLEVEIQLIPKNGEILASRVFYITIIPRLPGPVR